MHTAHPWGCSTGRHAVIARIWQDWHAWTSHPISTVAAIPWKRDTGDQMPWSRTADVDGQDLAVLLHRIAEGTEPVWENTAWTVDGHGIPLAGTLAFQRSKGRRFRRERGLGP